MSESLLDFFSFSVLFSRLPSDSLSWCWLREIFDDAQLAELLIFSRVLRDSTPRFVGRSVGLSVGHILLFL